MGNAAEYITRSVEDQPPNPCETSGNKENPTVCGLIHICGKLENRMACPKYWAYCEEASRMESTGLLACGKRVADMDDDELWTPTTRVYNALFGTEL